MQISNVQNTNFGAIKITPAKFGKFDSRDLSEFTTIAKNNGAELETGHISGDKFSFNVMTKQGSLEEKQAFLSILEYIGVSGKSLNANSIPDKQAQNSVDKINKLGRKK